MSSPRVTLLASLALLATACGGDPQPAGDDDDAPSVDAGAEADAAEAPPEDAMPASPDAEPSADAQPQPTCTAWQVDLDTTVPAGTVRTATIADGVLDLTAAGDRDGSCSSALEPCTAMLLYQGQLHGDFDVSLEVDEMNGLALFDQVSLMTTSGSGGAYARYDAIAVGGHEGYGTLFALHHTSYSDHQGYSRGTSTTEATLRITRVGADLTLTATTAALTLTETFSSSGDLYLAIALDMMPSETLDPSTPVHARVDNLVVIGGGGEVVSDSFEDACALVPM
jgi:hypothetical protein